MRRALLLALPLLAGCTVAQVQVGFETCPPGTEAATVTEAYFGRGLRGGGEVTDAQWDAFLREVVTPAFPDGLTALDAAGQWRRPDGTILRERSKLLVLVLPGADVATARARFMPVETVWKTRFAQQSVLTVHRPACVGF